MDEKNGILKFISIHRDEIFMSLVISFIYSGIVLITHVVLLSLPSGILPLIFSIVWFGIFNVPNGINLYFWRLIC